MLNLNVLLPKLEEQGFCLRKEHQMFAVLVGVPGHLHAHTSNSHWLPDHHSTEASLNMF